MRGVFGVSAAAILIMAAAPVVGEAGQTSGSAATTPRITIGAGGGRGTSALHDDASGPVWEAAARFHKNKWFAVEVVTGALHTKTTTPVPQLQLDITQEARSSWTGVNALATATIGRVTLSGGGGAGLGLFHRTFTQGDFTNEHSSGGLRVQGVGGVDVAVGPRTIVYGLARFGVMDGYVDSSIAAGVRFAIAAR